jgi:site-specific recombinase XerD
MAPDDLPSLLESWRLHLRGQRKSPQTLKTYTDGVRLWLAWCQRTGTPATLDRPTVNAFVADLLDLGAEASTARSRQLAVRRFSAWLTEEGEQDKDPLIGLKPPKLDSKVVPILTDDQIRHLVKACAGKEFRDRRDEAIVRLMVETGVRSEELLSMEIPDLDLTAARFTIRRGKGGKGRSLDHISPQTIASVDRYIRTRRTHRLAGTPVLWLGDRGKEFGYHALRDTLRYRAELAGLPAGFSPHKLRHTAASRWLEKGGSEGGLMARAGWSRRDMIDRYTRATSERRAGEEAQRLNLGGDF